jgi:hypothetical protein
MAWTNRDHRHQAQDIVTVRNSHRSNHLNSCTVRPSAFRRFHRCHRCGRHYHLLSSLFIDLGIRSRWSRSPWGSALGADSRPSLVVTVCSRWSRWAEQATLRNFHSGLRVLGGKIRLALPSIAGQGASAPHAKRLCRLAHHAHRRYIK